MTQGTIKTTDPTLVLFQAALVAKFGEGAVVNLAQMEEVVFAATGGKVTCAPAKYRSNKAYKIGKGKWIVTAEIRHFVKADAVVDAVAAPAAPAPIIAQAPVEVRPFTKVSKAKIVKKAA